ncbi:hypothetical protein BUALT_Bualt02G0083400 [Buddleja alternifolia]|uniref:Homologous recombination OB-fold protein OB-fold domain-containing protein n=1 Tax=Buddleja alternifolia TaxID=168488 RepID=A0AAV6Y583_9LAMI|nr:hypothetical protein BUALT_Bualt02G0083400 [Buddleja alternifolia]
MEVEAWEALDVDDSDLPSLLRPCKHRRRSTSPTAKALTSQSLSEENHPQPPVSTSCLLRTIPGPAAAVQAAMLRKNLDRQHHNFSHTTQEHHNPVPVGFNHNNSYNDGVISTQDYIRRAMEDTSEFDDDFTRHPWISALQFLGAEDGVIRSTPISSIKKCLNAGKVDQVVAVIKTCTPNGLGGLKVMLKDPTGTVGGSIHHKVLCENEFGKNITIGAVLILQKVAIFAPVRSAHYLNITSRNLVKVFCRDAGSSSKTNNSAYPIQYAYPDIENCGKAKTLEKTSTTQNSTNGNTAIEKRECTRAENLQNVSAAVRRRHINLSQDACNKIPEDIIRTRITDDQREFVNGSDKVAKGGNLEGSLLDNTDNMTNPMEKSTGDEIEVINEGQMQKQPLILKPSLPQWTDEQLDELFAGDEEDDSLF